MAGSIAVCTLLFTDIEGSTALLQHAGSRYMDLLERHRTIIRTALVTGGGVERAADGDSFFFVFDTPSTAIAATTDAQLGLEREPWPNDERVRVRMVVHVGEEWIRTSYTLVAPKRLARVVLEQDAQARSM